MKKTKAKNNRNGITICDSIVMSVKKRSINLRKIEAIAIAASGFTAVIMAFLGMFEFSYDQPKLITAAVGFSLFYITLTVIEGKALWVLTASLLVFAGAAYKSLDKLTLGFKYAYNVIYNESYGTKTGYYDHLKPLLEEESVTALFFFAVWLLAIVIYFFTISRPNPILPLMVTFPIIEIGLYNGIEISIFWGMLVIAYWLALLGMSTIDIGEYSGGTGGFVRKEDLFFPKRQMKLKVTEKCGVFVIASVMLISAITGTLISITDYTRSDEIDKKREDISNAFSEFSFDDISGSLSNLIDAFGFSFDFGFGKKKNEKLGSNEKISYKNTTDFIAYFSDTPYSSIYLKDGVKSVYKNNEWSDLGKSSYDTDLFKLFKDTSLYPQDFPGVFLGQTIKSGEGIDLRIETKTKGLGAIAPYGIVDAEKHTDDTIATNGSGKEQSYLFYETDPYKTVPYITDYNYSRYISYGSFTGDPDREILQKLIDEDRVPLIYDGSDDDNFSSQMLELPFTGLSEQCNNMTLTAKFAASLILENAYKDFVYQNYLQVPDTDAMDAVWNEYASLLSQGSYMSTPEAKLGLLDKIRDKMSASTSYTLSPGKTPSSADFVSYFLLENHKGYCVHYATAGVMLARMAGIPARYATGYIIFPKDFGNHTKDDGFYEIDVKDNRSHAWVEVYIDGVGWMPYEFTSGYVQNTTSIVTTVTTTTTTRITTERTTDARTTDSTTKITSASTVVSTVTTAAAGKRSFFTANTVKTLKKIFAFILPFAVFVLIIFLRRCFMTALRRKRIYEGSKSRNIANIYDYTIKLLNELVICAENMKYVEFAEYAEERIGGKYTDKESIIRLTETALRSGFGNTPPSKEELDECRKTAEALAKNIYNDSGFIQKLSMKYLKCLI